MVLRLSAKCRASDHANFWQRLRIYKDSHPNFGMCFVQGLHTVKEIRFHQRGLGMRPRTETAPAARRS